MRAEFFKGAKPADLEHMTLEMSRLGRQTAPRLLKRLARQPGAKKRAADWKRSVRERLENMKAGHDRGNPFAVYRALQFCSDIGIPTPLWASDCILADLRKRLAGKRKRTAQQERIFDSVCLYSFNDLSKRELSKRAAWKQVGKLLNLSGGAVRARCEKAASGNGSHPIL